MNHTTRLRPPPTPPSGRRRWWAAGFTLIELIVVVIIMAILVGIATFGYNRFTGQAKDTVTATNLREMGKALIVDLQHRQGSTYTMDDVTLVANQVSPLVADGAPHLTVTTGPATVTDVSVAIDAIDAGKVGLALRSPTGKCFLVRLDGVDLKAGQGNDSPTCTGTIAKDTANLDDPTAAPGGSGNNSGTDSGTPADGSGFNGTLRAPEGLRANTAYPDATDTSLAWLAVPGAEAYEVYLDDQPAPYTTVSATSTVLKAIGEGGHRVTVRATRGSGASLLRSPGAEVSFTLKYADNDMAANAHPLTLAMSDTAPFVQQSNLQATLEPGETGGYRSLWWKFTPTVDASYGLQFTSGATTNVRVTTVADPAAPGDIDDVSVPNTGTQRLNYVLKSGKTYYIRVATTSNSGTTYRLRVVQGPANDMFVNAATLATPAPGESLKVDAPDAAQATMEPAESGSGLARSLWWTMTPSRSGPYVFTLSGASLRIGTNRNVALVSTVADVRGSTVVKGVDMIAGTTYYIQIAATGSSSISSFLVSGGSLNDNVANAQDLGVLAVGASKAFGAVSAAATMEPGEGPTGQIRSLWWKITPPTTGGYSFQTTRPTTSGWALVRVGTSSDVTVRGSIVEGSLAGGGPYTLTGGTTYYVRTTVQDALESNYTLTVTRAS